MPNESYQKDWKLCGEIDPYYGVLSDDRFRSRHLTEEARTDFFHSGEEHVKRLMEKIKLHVSAGFHPTRTLDFGCGVGRLLIPFSKVSRQVTGVDISKGMLLEARTNCDIAGISNVSFEPSIDRIDGVFDLVHSYIVFQHIPSAIGIRTMEQLIALVATGGVIAIHFTYSNQGSTLRKKISDLRSKFRLLHHIINVFQKRAIKEPLIQMNEYQTNQIMEMLQKNNFTDLHISFTQHGNLFGMMLIGRKCNSAYVF